MTNMDPGGRSLCLTAAGEVGVCKEMRLYGADLVTHPSHGTQVLRIGNVSNQALELAIAFDSPFRYELSKVTARMKQAKMRQLRCPDNMH